MSFSHQPHHAQRRKHRRGEEETEIRRAGEHRACSEVIGNQHRGKQQGAERLPPGEQHAADHYQHQRETGIPCQPRENRFGAQTVDVAQRAVQQAGRNLGCQAEGFGAGIDVRRNPPVGVAKRPQRHLHQVTQRLDCQRRFLHGGAQSEAVNLQKRVGLVEINRSGVPLDVVPVADGVVLHVDRARRDVFQKLDGFVIEGFRRLIIDVGQDRHRNAERLVQLRALALDAKRLIQRPANAQRHQHGDKQGGQNAFPPLGQSDQQPRARGQSHRHAVVPQNGAQAERRAKRETARGGKAFPL